MTSFDTGTKNLPYRPGFPTPVALPDTTACRVFRIPADDSNGTWQATFMGLLMFLSDPANWVQQEDGLDAETCAERWQQMLDNAYDTAEFGCAVTFPAPDDEQIPVFRINASTGRLEELDDTQTWVEPFGDYAVPAIPARGGSEEDAICLAAMNAANVLEALYEQITDGIASGNELDEILLSIITTFVVAVGWGAAAGILFSLGFIALVALGVVVAIIATFGADVWDETFTDKLVCILVDCAEYSAGVVTFDYQCVLDELAAVTSEGLTFDQLRLFGQLAFILQTIGGADGLNQAGATTEITSATCECTWCAEFDFTVDDGGFAVIPAAPYGTWVSGQGWTSEGGLGGQVLEIQFDAGFSFNLTSMTALFHANSNPNNNGDVRLDSTLLSSWSGGKNDGDQTAIFSGSVNGQVFKWVQGNGSGGGDGSGGSFYLYHLELCGTGDNPFA